MPNALNLALKAEMRPGAGLLIPGAANALAARVIEEAGFRAFLVTGAGVANTFLGVPDVGLVSVTELSEHVAAMRDAVNLPMIADGDTGFGNAVNVGRTVRLLERAGANAMQLEDQTFPKKCGHFEGKDVIPCSEMVQKIKAAVDARQDQDFQILARTDARAVEGMQAALDRANAYREAGADMLFVEAPRSLEELAAIPKGAPGVHICNMVIGGKTPLLPASELGAMGYAGVVYANAALQSGLLAMQQVLGHIHRNGSIAGVEDRIMMFDDRQRMVRHDHYKALEKRYTLRDG
jgi:2-methylisocitrate lyase-like PEP mutase family enzyme